MQSSRCSEEPEHWNCEQQCRSRERMSEHHDYLLGLRSAVQERAPEQHHRVE